MLTNEHIGVTCGHIHTDFDVAPYELDSHNIPDKMQQEMTSPVVGTNYQQQWNEDSREMIKPHRESLIYKKIEQTWDHPLKEVIVLTFTSSNDSQPSVKLERMRANQLLKSRIIHVEKTEDVVVYRPDGKDLESQLPAPVNMTFTLVFSHKYDKQKKWKCLRKLSIWYPESAKYDHYKEKSVTMFDTILEKMAGNYVNYIMQIVREMQNNPVILKIISTVSLPEGYNEDDETDYYEPVVIRNDVQTIEAEAVAEVVTEKWEKEYKEEDLQEPLIIPLVRDKVSSAPPNYENLDHEEYKNASKPSMREKFKSVILWIAKKQRILQILEHAFPNHMSLQEIVKIIQLKWGSFVDHRCVAGKVETSQVVVISILQQLENKELVRKLDNGRFMRIPKGKQHEVKIVKQLPMLSRSEHPTIGIVTALYCEKLAVDTMMENKITYIRYRAEGDTHIYTLGTIGKHKVVVTKLAQIGSDKASQISAENAVTRLLGTFNMIEHVFLVGVAGGVPNSTWTRLGDVVVSTATKNDNAIYIVGENVSRIDNEVDVRARSWHAKDRTLQKLNEKVSNDILNGSESCKPWTQYLSNGQKMIQEGEVNFINFSRPKSDFDEPMVYYGPFGSGKALMTHQDIRQQFAESRGILAFDHHFDAVLKSFEGSRQESFYIIRGIADWVDGWEQTRWESIAKWQPYCSLAAASYMAALFNALPPIKK